MRLRASSALAKHSCPDILRGSITGGKPYYAVREVYAELRANGIVDPRPESWRKPLAYSGRHYLSGPVFDEETILYASLDLAEIIANV